MKNNFKNKVTAMVALGCLMAGSAVSGLQGLPVQATEANSAITVSAQATGTVLKNGIALQYGTEVTATGTLSYCHGKNRPILELDQPITITYEGSSTKLSYIRINEENLSYTEGTKLTVTGSASGAFAGGSSYMIFLDDCTIQKNNSNTKNSSKEKNSVSVVDVGTYQIGKSKNKISLKVVLYSDHTISIYVNKKLSNLANVKVPKSNAQNPTSTDVDDYFTVLGENSIQIKQNTTEESDGYEEISYNYDYSSKKFYQSEEKSSKNSKKAGAVTVVVPTSYVQAYCEKRGQKITESNYKTSMVVTCSSITSCSNGTASIVGETGGFVQGFRVTNAKPGKIVISGTSGTYSSADSPNINSSHGQCGVDGDPDTFTISVTIDEDGNIIK